MAQSEILGLFGKTPQQLRNEYTDSGLVTPAQMGSQGLLQQVVSMGGNAGSIIGSSLGGLLGGAAPGEREAMQFQDALSQVNQMNLPSSYEKYKAMSGLLAEKGLGGASMAMATEAEKLKPKAAETTKLAQLMQEQARFPEGSPQWNAYQGAIDKETTNTPSSQPQIVQLQGILKNLPPNSVEAKQVQAAINKLIEPSKGPQVKIDMPASQTAYGKTVGEGIAKKDLSFVQSAQSVAESLPQIYETANLIETSDDLVTGIGSGVFKDFYRVVDQFTSDKKAGKKVSDTEYLDALMGREVFTQINALGIGARGLDTPAEREFLRSVMTGSIELNEKTLAKLTDLRVRVAERAVKKYNEKLKNGELDRYMRETGEQLKPIELPQRTSLEDKTRMVAKLKSNPQYANLTDKQAIRALRKAGKIQ